MSIFDIYPPDGPPKIRIPNVVRVLAGIRLTERASLVTYYSLRRIRMCLKGSVTGIPSTEHGDYSSFSAYYCYNCSTTFIGSEFEDFKHNCPEARFSYVDLHKTGMWKEQEERRNAA